MPDPVLNQARRVLCTTLPDPFSIQAHFRVFRSFRGSSARFEPVPFSFGTFARSPLSISISGIPISVSFPPIARSASRPAAWLGHRFLSWVATRCGAKRYGNDVPVRVWSVERPKTAHGFFGLEPGPKTSALVFRPWDLSCHHASEGGVCASLLRICVFFSSPSEPLLSEKTSSHN